MLLQTRIKVVLLGLLTVCIAWTLVVQYWVVYRTYTQVQQAEATDDVRRCVDAIRREGYHLEVLASDWATWDDAYRYVEDRNPEFKATTLNLNSMESAHLNLLCLVDESNSVVWYSAMDHESGNPLTLQAFSQATLPSDHPLLTHREGRDTGQILKTERGMMLVASRPILPSNRQGPVRGTLIMGRFFSDANLEMLIQQTHIRFTAWNLSAQSLPAKVQEVLTKLAPGKILISADAEADSLQGYAILDDVFGQPALLVDATIPRTIAGPGLEATLLACLGLVTVAVIVWAVLLGFLNRYVVWPVLRLRRRIASLNLRDDPSARIAVQRDDEIGSLAVAFNTILDGLAEKSPHGHRRGSTPDKLQQEPHLVQTGAN
jgi:sensor domain CHASE-containing protein